MNYIVLDLEWNQSNTGEEPEVKEIPFEIIDIGAIKLNSDRSMIDEFNQLIKPTVYLHMHKITSKLIHLHMRDLQKGRPFKEVMNEFLEWCGDDYIFCTWGPLDLYEMQRNIRYYQMNSLSDVPLRFLDIQKLFSIAYEDSKSRRSLEYAIDFLKIEKDIPFHRAFSDAYYTAKLLTGIAEQKPEVLRRISFDTFHPPKTRAEEVKVQFDTYVKYISREFDSKAEAFADREVSSSKCYLCHKNLRKKIRWFSPNSKHYYCLARCDKHGYLKGKLRIHKSESGKLFAVKITKLITEEEAERLKERCDNAKKMQKYKNSAN